MAKSHLALVAPATLWDSRGFPPATQTGTQYRSAGPRLAPRSTGSSRRPGRWRAADERDAVLRWRGYPSVESLKIGRHGRTYRRASEAS
jgi:hypothetical protein